MWQRPARGVVTGMIPQSLRLLGSLIPVAVAAAACHDATAPTSQAISLARAKALWTAAGVRTYSFTATRSCLCTPEAVGPVRVTVTNGQITGVTLIETGDPVAPGTWFDINGLFALIESELAARPNLLQVTFDPATGYPTHVKYGDITVDAGAEITVTNFASPLE